jgi:alkanesulfonate monooxygenase SsuD/methylene tetrahydromethanopterin reductase-like flavin-dependent oxidoreductase (luciferase family)
MAAACVDHFSNGRFVLGLGSSHKVQVEVEHGVYYTEPVTRVRETVEVVRALLRDGAVSFRGKTITIEHFDLWFKPAHASVPIYLSALFPQMLGLCGEIAQGLLMVFSTLGSARTATEHLSAGAVRAGRNVKEIEIASLVPASVARDRKTAYDRVRPVLAFYLGYFPRYQRVAREAGFGAAVDMIADASRRGNSECTLAAIPDEMVAELTASGTAADLRARIAEYRRSGIGLPILMPVQSGPDSMAGVVETLRAGAG